VQKLKKLKKLTSGLNFSFTKDLINNKNIFFIPISKLSLVWLCPKPFKQSSIPKLFKQSNIQTLPNGFNLNF